MWLRIRWNGLRRLPAYKQEFPEMHVVYIYNLLICDFFEKVVDDLILMC